MSVDAYALTTLANALEELGLTSDSGSQDAYVENIINRTSDIIENYCHRQFKARLYVKERYDGKGQELLYLNQYPVLAVNLDELVWDNATKTVTRSDGGSFVDDGFSAGDKVLVQNSNCNGGLLTIAIDGVAANTLTFTDAITDDTEDNNVIISHFREFWVNDNEIDRDDYEVFLDHLYISGGLSKGHGNIRITYYAGYSTIPDDLEQACLKMVKLGYEKNASKKSESLGPYSVTYFDTKDIPNDVKIILDKYRRLVI
jgi:hypothetical protein